ncbi:MAG: prepilin-type N-terminal cleavage/methylation domain-containing protein [Rubrivivax sp.]
MNTRLTSHAAARGFTLIEALIALAVVAFGLMGIASMQGLLSRSSDVAKQRSEAVRLAQQQIETMRAYTSIAVVAGQTSWNGLANGTDTTTTNATYTRTWTVAGVTTDPMRRVSVNVAWTDRAGEAQNVTLNSVISKTDPIDVGLMGFPLPQNTTLKRPKNRNLNIPVPAVDLGNGKSVYQLANNFAVVFGNDTGYVVMKCDFVVSSASQLDSCITYSAYILAGYVSLSGGSFPGGLGLNTAGLTGTTGVTCTMGNAVDQNDGTTIAGYKYYLCVVALAPNTTWSGTVKLTGMQTGTDLLVCRFQFPSSGSVSANARNVQPYSTVAESLDNQNYVITTSSACPTIGGLATTLHQNCRSNNPNKNLNRATDCPA